nr:MAG TPA: hypothetical protein [Caudoviricetes sp.]
MERNFMRFCGTKVETICYFVELCVDNRMNFIK